jgi:hypothetical protein
VSTSSQRPFRPTGSFAGVSHNAHERPGQEWRATESDNANTFALHTNGEERASLRRHPAENDYDPLQSPYAPKKEPAQPTIEDNLALSEDATHRTSEGVGDSIDQCVVNVTPDGTADQQELERLVANVRSVQREEAAARFPTAAQLPSVPGLAAVSDGMWPPHSLEPDYLAERDTLRGPRTIIKSVFLIVSIFTVPIASYFWIGGWDTISGAPPPELASFNSRPIIPPPKPSGEEETTGDPGTPAKGERRTAKSFAGETVAMLQPATPGTQDPHSSTAARAPNPLSQPETAPNDLRPPANAEPRTAKSSAVMLQPGTPSAQAPLSSPVVRALDAEQIKLLMKQGEQFIAAGDVVTARTAFQRAAEAGDAKAAVALGAAYDPTVLAKLGVVGISADVAKARSWYQKAEKLGSPEAKRRLEALADR